MSGSSQNQGDALVPAVPSEHRKKLRIGFMLCSAAFALALFELLGTYGAILVASANGVNLQKEFELQMKLVREVSDGVYNALFIAGLINLYVAPTGPRWRWAGTALLGMVGMDVSFQCLRIAGSGPAVLAVVELIGGGLNWAELWLIAILAAEAAETLLRSDLTYQTEVAGRMIVAGAVAWLAFVIWTFDVQTFAEPAANQHSDDFAGVLLAGMVVIQLFVLARSMLFCGGLATALAHPIEPPPTGQAASPNE